MPASVAWAVGLGLLADVGQGVEHGPVGHVQREGGALLELAVLRVLVVDDVERLGVAALALDVGLPVELGDAVQRLGAAAGRRGW